MFRLWPAAAQLKWTEKLLRFFSGTRSGRLNDSRQT
jgi:hypothetical protein